MNLNSKNLEFNKVVLNENIETFCLDFLKNIFSNHKSKKYNYSVRKFAKDLDVSPSYLSLLLLGKKGMSEEMARKIASKINLNPIETNLFVSSAIYCFSKNETQKKTSENIFNSNLLTSKDLIAPCFGLKDEFSLNENLILLILSRVQAYIDRSYLENKLRIKPDEIDQALARLKKKEMISISDIQKIQLSPRVRPDVYSIPFFLTKTECGDQKFNFKFILPSRLDVLSEIEKLINQFKADLLSKTIKYSNETEAIHILDFSFLTKVDLT